MPLPMPSGQHDTEKKWMDACMGHATMNSEYPDAKQRAAVCHGQWDKHMKNKTAHAYGHFALVAGSTDVGGLKRIMLTPWGEVKSRNMDFVIDDESAAAIVAAFDAGGRDIPIDFEHTTVGGKFATASGAAPAAGWITKIVAEKGVGIFGLVKWNAAAAAMITADEYRWLSPVVVYRKKDRKAVEIQSAALTNKPALIDIERVAAKDAGDGAGEQTMNLTKLRALLSAAGVSLPDSADETAVLTAAETFMEATAKKVAEPTPLGAIAAKMGLAADATVETITAKVVELQTNVPAAEYKVVTARLEALETAAKDREGQELVALAIETAKLNPNHEPSMKHAREWAKRDPVAFKAWADSAPALYTAGRVVVPSAKLDGEGGRETVIAVACSEYDDAPPGFKKITGRVAFVNDALSMKKLPPLDKDELK